MFFLHNVGNEVADISSVVVFAKLVVNRAMPAAWVSSDRLPRCMWMCWPVVPSVLDMSSSEPIASVSVR